MTKPMLLSLSALTLGLVAIAISFMLAVSVVSARPAPTRGYPTRPAATPTRYVYTPQPCPTVGDLHVCGR